MNASLERILPTVVRPARYTGNEWNSVRKEWSGRLHIALIYPDVYEEGMCQYGLLSLYDLLNRDDDLLCERAFLPWPDMEQAMRQAGAPLFTLESRRSLAEFDLLVVVLPSELYAPAVLTVLDLAGLPLRAADRRAGEGTHPWVIGIGAGSANPEPLGDFCDAFIIGEPDAAVLRETVQALRGLQAPPQGAYIPRLYAVRYNQDGAISQVEPAQPVRARHAPVPPPLTRPIVPFIEVNRERAVVELAHPPAYPWTGQAWRERPSEQALAAVEATLRATGYDHVVLTGQHPRLADIAASLSTRYAGAHAHVSLETIAPAPEAVDVADRLPHIGRGTLSLDVTSGSDELRAALGLAPADCAGAARLAFRRGWHVVKLNVNVGLPGETDADVEATIRLARQIRDIGHAEIDGRAQVQVVAAPFIARAHGPWQRAALPDGEQWDKRVSLLAQGVRGPSLRLVWRGLDTRLIEAALARGDRRLSAVIEGVWRSGVRRAADNRNIALWQAAFASADLNMAFYAARPRSTDEILPWQHIDIGG